jgi:predicted kinase
MNLYINVGAPGSGKSTHAAKFVSARALHDAALPLNVRPEPIVVLNADEIRGFYGWGEQDQSVSGEAFKFIGFAAEMLFRQGFSVLVDVTSKNKQSRAKLIELARKYNARTVAFVFDTPLSVCLERNASRARVVPPDVVERIFHEIQIPVMGEVDEVRVISHLQN